MSIKINYKNSNLKKPSNNLVLFTNEKFNIGPLKKYISNSEFSYIKGLIDTEDQKKNLLIFELSSKKKIVLVSIKENTKTFDIENLGAEFYGRINYGKNSEYFINSNSLNGKEKSLLEYFLHGLKLKSYEFNK